MRRRHLLLVFLLAAAFLSATGRAQSPGVPGTAPQSLPPIRLARGVTEVLPGGWRVSFPLDRDTLEADQRAAIGRLGAALKTGSTGRILLQAEASSGDDLSTQRRLSLARARAVKAALVAGGLEETRVDIRALGRTENARDAVDVLSPTAPR